MLNINISTPNTILLKLRDAFKSKRVEKKLTQNCLASSSGVSLGSLKRFESSGRISLESLLKLALVLECLEEFENVCKEKVINVSSIDELIERGNK